MPRQGLWIAGPGAGLAAVVAANLAWVGVGTAQERPAPLQSSAVQSSNEPATPAVAASPNQDGTQPALDATVPSSPLDGLKISSQSWRRGGLGSKALVTVTLRNANDYAVKDIEMLCTFTRRDGSYLTDRKRVIGEAVQMKSRRTFRQVHIGFVNVNAAKAKCALVAASRT